MLRPLTRAGARDAHARAPADTHFFARTTEDGIGHRLARLAGAVGVDAPRRYDDGWRPRRARRGRGLPAHARVGPRRRLGGARVRVYDDRTFHSGCH